jgi:YD repeat-containing protein
VTTQWVKSFSDGLGRSFRTEYPGNATETSTYHLATAAAGSRGKLASTQDADENSSVGTGKLVSYAYDGEGDLSTITEAIADGHSRITVQSHDVVSSVTIHGKTLQPALRSTQSVNGVVTSTSYRTVDGYASATDSLGRRTLSGSSLPNDGSWSVDSTSPDGQISTQVYSDGLLVSSTYFENDGTTVVTSTTNTYDNFGRSESTIDLRTGATTVVGRHPNGAVTAVETNNAVDTTSYTYDAMGRVVATTLPNNSVTYTSYTPRGKTLATWGSQTYARLYQYDSLGRMSELRTYQGLAYGAEPVMDPVETPGYAKTTWHYDPQRGWLTEKNYDGETGNGPGNALGNAADYTYTPSGLLETRTWERGVVTTYDYDHGVLESIAYSGETQATTPGVTYTYDSFGRPVTVAQSATSLQEANSHTYEYDASSLMLRRETIAYDIDGNGAPALTRILDRSHDGLLRPEGYGLKSGYGVEHETLYTYDNAGRLHTVAETEQSPALTFTYGYEPNSGNLLAGVLGPVHTVANTYEAHRNVLTNKENSITATNAVISHFAYTTNNIGQRTTLTTSGSAFATAPVYAWDYNGRGELIEANDASTANEDRAFEYDGIGNRKKSVEGSEIQRLTLCRLLAACKCHSRGGSKRVLDNTEPGSHSHTPPVDQVRWSHAAFVVTVLDRHLPRSVSERSLPFQHRPRQD